MTIVVPAQDLVTEAQKFAEVIPGDQMICIQFLVESPFAHIYCWWHEPHSLLGGLREDSEEIRTLRAELKKNREALQSQPYES
jgi:hypothetical protein